MSRLTLTPAPSVFPLSLPSLRRDGLSRIFDFRFARGGKREPRRRMTAISAGEPNRVSRERAIIVDCARSVAPDSRSDAIDGVIADRPEVSYRARGLPTYVALARATAVAERKGKPNRGSATSLAFSLARAHPDDTPSDLLVRKRERERELSCRKRAGTPGQFRVSTALAPSASSALAGGKTQFPKRQAAPPPSSCPPA